MRVSRSGLYLLFSALLILASIPVATRGLVGTGIPMAIGRVVIGALLMLCGVFMVATVLRSRLVIEESQIRFRIVFREEVIPHPSEQDRRAPNHHHGTYVAACVAARDLRKGPTRAY
jgi:hypothetical protein